MSSWSSSYSRNVPRANLKPTSSFDYQHGHSSNNTLDGGKHFRQSGSSKAWYPAENKIESTNINLPGSLSHYSHKEATDGGPSFRHWNNKPDWRLNVNDLDGSAASLSSNTHREGILQASMDWLSDLPPVKKNLGLLIKAPQDISSMGPSSHDSGFSDKPFNSAINMDNDTIGGDTRNLSYSNADLSAYQRKKTSKAFDYLKSWRLKMNMPTDSFMIEKQVPEHPKRENVGSLVLDTPPFQTSNYNTAVSGGSARPNNMDERNFATQSSSAQFEQRLYNTQGHVPNVEQNVKGGSRMNDLPWRTNSSSHSNQNQSGYKRNYSSTVMDNKDCSSSGSLLSKRPRLFDNDGSKRSPLQCDSNFQKQQFASEDSSPADWKNLTAIPKREGTDWPSRLGGQNYNQCPDKWSTQLDQNEQQSPRRVSGRGSPQHTNWSNSPGLHQRSNSGQYSRRLSPDRRSPDRPVWTRPLGEASRLRSPRAKSRSPVSQRGHSGRDSHRLSPGLPTSRMRSPGRSFSPKGRSPGMLQREKSGMPHKQRSQGPSSKGRSGSVTRGRSPKQQSRRSVSPVGPGISSRLTRERSPCSRRSSDRGNQRRSPHRHADDRLRYHNRGRSPGNSHNRSRMHSRSRSPAPFTRGRSHKASAEKSLERRTPDHFRSKRSPVSSRSRSPRGVGSDKSPLNVRREGIPKNFGRERSPREFVKRRPSGSIKRNESAKHNNRDRSHGRENSFNAKRYKSPTNIEKGKIGRDFGRGRLPHMKRDGERLNRSAAQANRERSPQSNQKQERWLEEMKKGPESRTFNQRKRSPESPNARRSGQDRNVKPGIYGRSPMFDELSPSPHSSCFLSPSHESLKGKQPEFKRRSSWSPDDLQRGCSPVSPQPTFECPDTRSGHMDSSPASSSTIRMKGVNMQPLELQRGCSPVSPEGYSRPWSSKIAKLCSRSPDEAGNFSDYKRNKASGKLREVSKLEAIPDSFDLYEEDGRGDMLSIMKNELSESGKRGDDDYEDLRVHLLRLREQKVEMKLKMLEEESIETELKLRQLQRKGMSEDEDELKNPFWNERDCGRSNSRGRDSRSASPSRRYSPREDHYVKYRDLERNHVNQHPRNMSHGNRQYLRKKRF